MSVIELQASEVGGESPGAVPGDAGFAALSRLRDAAAQVLAQPWAGRPGPVLGEALVELVTAERMVAAAKALVLGAFDATGQHRVEGHPSAATWVGATTKANPRQVKHQAQQARALREMPLTEAAFASGRIGAEHVAVLVRARTRDVVDEFAAAEADDRLREALDRLSEPQRRTLLLRYFGNLEFSEIGRVMQTPVNTVLSHGRRGLLMLRKLLEEKPA